MANIIQILLFLFLVNAFIGLEVWFVISLVQFIVAAARKRPEWKRKLGMFIAATACQVFVGGIVSLVIIFAYLFNF